MEIAVALDELEDLGDKVGRRQGELGGDGCSKFIMRRPRGGRLLLFLYVVRHSSLLTVPGLSVLGFFLESK